MKKGRDISMTRERSDRRDRVRAGSSERDTKHRSGGSLTTIDIPEGVDFFSPPSDGVVRFDIVPYKVGKGNPYAREGTWYYERTYFTHGRVGVNEDTYVCPNKTAGLPCPICEHRAVLAQTSNMDPKDLKKLLNSLRPKERQLWLLRPVGKGVEGSELKLWDVSFHLFGKLLDKKRKTAEDDEVHITDFDDEQAGSTLKCEFTEETGDGMKWVECYSIEFLPRKDGLEPESLMDHGICLDSIIKVPSYDELKKIFLQEVPDEDADKDEDDDEPKKEETKKPAEAEVEYEEGQKVRHRQFGICEIKRISDDGSLGLVGLEGDNKGTKYKGVDPKNVRPLQEETKKSKNPTSARSVEKESTRKSGKTEDSAKSTTKSRSDDDDWDDEPKKKQKQESKDDDDDDWGKSSKSDKQESKSKPKDDDDWDDEPKKSSKEKQPAKSKDDDWD